MRGIHWWPVNSPHNWSVTWKMFPFDDVMMALWDPAMFKQGCKQEISDSLDIAFIHHDSHGQSYERYQCLWCTKSLPYIWAAWSTWVNPWINMPYRVHPTRAATSVWFRAISGPKWQVTMVAVSPFSGVKATKYKYPPFCGRHFHIHSICIICCNSIRKFT